MNQMKMTFEEWMKVVDATVNQVFGLSVYDLPDYPFRDAYEDGRRPKAVAVAAMKAAGG